MKLRPLSPSRYARLERDEAALRAAAERPKDKEVKRAAMAARQMKR